MLQCNRTGKLVSGCVRTCKVITTRAIYCTCTQLYPCNLIHAQLFSNGEDCVDKSDQILSSNNLLRKCVRWWKTLFFHMIDIATVNSFLLFQAHRKQFPDQLSLQRPSCYSLLEFREELVREILQLEEFAKPPVATVGKQKDISIYNTDHMVMFSETKRNCKVCYAGLKKFESRSCRDTDVTHVPCLGTRTSVYLI